MCGNYVAAVGLVVSMGCRQTRPKIVGWANGIQRKNKTEVAMRPPPRFDAAFLIELRLARTVAVLVDARLAGDLRRMAAAQEPAVRLLVHDPFRAVGRRVSRRLAAQRAVGVVPILTL